MAKAKAKIVVDVTLKLDAEEAGYLLDLLSAHVGGNLCLEDEPLGRIRIALEGVAVRRLYAVNKQRTGSRYAALYRD